MGLVLRKEKDFGHAVHDECGRAGLSRMQLAERIAKSEKAKVNTVYQRLVRASRSGRWSLDLALAASKALGMEVVVR